VRAQRLELGTEQEQVAESRPVKRLDAGSIAREVQRSRLAVPRTEGEHAVESFQGRRDTPVRARLDQDLAVGLPAKRSSCGCELGPQLGMVVDLPVVDQDETPARGEYRLPDGLGEIADREAAVCERNPRCPIDPDTGVIRPAMAQ
jgi:hypothetical protein